MHSIPQKNTLSIGNSENDACMLRYTNLSYAFKPADEEAELPANKTAQEFREIKL